MPGTAATSSKRSAAPNAPPLSDSSRNGAAATRRRPAAAARRRRRRATAGPGGRARRRPPTATRRAASEREQLAAAVGRDRGHERIVGEDRRRRSGAAAAAAPPAAAGRARRPRRDAAPTTDGLDEAVADGHEVGDARARCSRCRPCAARVPSQCRWNAPTRVPVGSREPIPPNQQSSAARHAAAFICRYGSAALSAVEYERDDDAVLEAAQRGARSPAADGDGSETSRTPSARPTRSASCRPAPPQTVASVCHDSPSQARIPRGTTALPSTRQQPAVRRPERQRAGRAQRDLERRAGRRRGLLQPPARLVGAAAATSPAHSASATTRVRSLDRRRTSRRPLSRTSSISIATHRRQQRLERDAGHRLVRRAAPARSRAPRPSWRAARSCARSTASPTIRSTSRSISSSVAGPTEPSSCSEAPRKTSPPCSPIVTKPELGRHAERRDHRAREVGRGVQVVVDRRSRRTPNCTRSPAAPATIARQLALQVVLLHDRDVLVDELRRGGAERAPAGDDRELLRAAAGRSGRSRARRRRATPRGSRSPGARAALSTCDFFAGPATTRSIASSSVAWSIVALPLADGQQRAPR